jgi:hypothetical protein
MKRITVSVYNCNDEKKPVKEIKLPKVFACPLR